jgi:hypothetical protein
MGSRARRKQRWSTQTLTPLLEGPDPDMQEEGNKKESSWEVIREWFRLQKGLPAGNSFSVSLHGSIPVKGQDLRLLLGVLGCPLAPIPLVNDPIHRIHIKNTPIVSSSTLLIHMFIFLIRQLHLINFFYRKILPRIISSNNIWQQQGV